jgi:hypothetical protein
VSIYAQSPQKFTDPIVLLQQVAKTYAAGTDTFRMEAIEETVRHNELHGTIAGLLTELLQVHS